MKEPAIIKEALKEQQQLLAAALDAANQELLQQWPQLQEKYDKDTFEFTVRDKTIRLPLTTSSLSGTRIKKVLLPQYKDWGDILKWQLQENIPGKFRFSAQNIRSSSYRCRSRSGARRTP